MKEVKKKNIRQWKSTFKASRWLR